MQLVHVAVKIHAFCVREDAHARFSNRALAASSSGATRNAATSGIGFAAATAATAVLNCVLNLIVQNFARAMNLANRDSALALAGWKAAPAKRPKGQGGAFDDNGAGAWG